jgi:peptidoglycan hydrolase CwlO-like protein
LSTLTKILIVLLTLSSIFLCGITVTYIGTATNYKKAFDERKSRMDSLNSQNQGLADQVDQLNKDKLEANTVFEQGIKQRNDEINELTQEMKKYELEIADLNTRLKNNEAIVASNTQTVEINNQIRREAEAKIADLESLKTQNQEKIDYLTAQIVENQAKMDQLEIDKKQITEEKTQLQDRLDQQLRMVGKGAITSVPVTASSDSAQIAPPVRDLGLEGKVKEVKLQDSLASISIGSANGVKEGMIFHVIRDNKFICDIRITQTDADQASGYIDRISDGQPRSGDIVKTNF